MAPNSCHAGASMKYVLAMLEMWCVQKGLWDSANHRGLELPKTLGKSRASLLVFFEILFGEFSIDKMLNVDNARVDGARKSGKKEAKRPKTGGPLATANRHDPALLRLDDIRTGTQSTNSVSNSSVLNLDSDPCDTGISVWPHRVAEILNAWADLNPLPLASFERDSSAGLGLADLVAQFLTHEVEALKVTLQGCGGNANEAIAEIESLCITVSDGSRTLCEEEDWAAERHTSCDHNGLPSPDEKIWHADV
ncbi:uncharacterized protein CDV56_100011 [Aspergillus thermomutatus]|uniref:Uncharacterized protein n=1 Tax=Aspergillus thermomutatus TaxID=41047 RepID=A0A397FZX2_ASPTH|nr:uncharacterized protein CDV56_100011 [Aspergillus thermomutatus]RHZ44007.1 hypothetical protein CDV56_100011 [Aspergillus thermomutatus]